MNTTIYHGGGMFRSSFGTGAGGGPIGPSEIVVPYAATITIDLLPYFNESVFHIIATGNFTMAAPLNPSPAKKFILRVKQDATGGRLITWNAVFRFGVSLPTPILSILGNATDVLAFMYNGQSLTWDYIGEAFGL